MIDFFLSDVLKINVDLLVGTLYNLKGTQIYLAGDFNGRRRTFGYE